MLPILEYMYILDFLMAAVRWIQMRRFQRNVEAENDRLDFELTMMTDMFMQNVIIWLQLMLLFLKYLGITTKRRKLFKPHLLLKLLGGYR